MKRFGNPLREGNLGRIPKGTKGLGTIAHPEWLQAFEHIRPTQQAGSSAKASPAVSQSRCSQYQTAGNTHFSKVRSYLPGDFVSQLSPGMARSPQKVDFTKPTGMLSGSQYPAYQVTHKAEVNL
jgi:hypothetical protein